MNDDDHRADGHDEAPSLRQRLHAATGDRDAEAHTLADSAGDDVTERDAKIAVQRSRGEAGADEPVVPHDIATMGDAEGVAAQHRTGDAQARANGDDDPPA